MSAGLELWYGIRAKFRLAHETEASWKQWPTDRYWATREELMPLIAGLSSYYPSITFGVMELMLPVAKIDLISIGTTGR